MLQKMSPIHFFRNVRLVTILECFKKAFAVFDKERSGKISADSIRRALCKTGNGFL